MVTGKPWNETEVMLACEAFAWMLGHQLRGEKYNKSQVRRIHLPMLDGRSAGSWEMKMCNISAAAIKTGLPWVTGYKPRSGYQRSLEVALVKACEAAGINKL